MSETVVNLLPLEASERPQFEAALPNATHIYAGRKSVTPQHLSAATVILGWPRPESLKQASQLKWLHSMWAGVDEYLAPGILAPGARLTTSSGTNSQSVSEHMLASLLALCRKLPLSRDNQRLHRWEDVGNLRTLTGATVLVAGAGNIGGAFASLCQGLGAHTVGLRRRVGPPTPGFHELHSIDALDHWLPQADVVALVLPQSAETQNLMDARRIGLMKPGAMLISAGRGTVLDQNALIAALESGALWGAALDVTHPEPLPPEHPLWDAPNLLLTPHVAGGMRLEVTRKNCVALALENLRRYATGQALLNQVSHP